MKYQFSSIHKGKKITTKLKLTKKDRDVIERYLGELATRKMSIEFYRSRIHYDTYFCDIKSHRYSHYKILLCLVMNDMKDEIVPFPYVSLQFLNRHTNKKLVVPILRTTGV
jgi:hypothetical protein